MWEQLLEQAQERMTNELSLNTTQEAHSWQILSDMADAMLETLKARSIPFDAKSLKYIIQGMEIADKQGWLVVIPDE